MSDSSHSLAAVLVAAAGELADCAAMADELGGISMGDVERWQSLDRLSQKLAGLAAFMKTLSFVVPPVEPDLAGALDVITMTALADRLAGRPRAADGGGGDLELFGA